METAYPEKQQKHLYYPAQCSDKRFKDLEYLGVTAHRQAIYYQGLFGFLISADRKRNLGRQMLERQNLTDCKEI